MSDRPIVELDSQAGLVRPARLLTHPPADDLVSARLHRDRVWEPFESRLWLASQRRGDVIVDVGANIGYFSVLSGLSEDVPAAVLAFEPDPDNFSLLQQNLRLNGLEDTVKATRAALSTVSGEGVLHRNPDNLGDHQIFPGEDARQEVAIKTLCGTDALVGLVERIDLLKVDTQGSELAVIAGLEPLLRYSRAGLRILIELTPFSLQLAGVSGRALVQRLTELDLPMAIVDHVEHRLVACPAEDLAVWCDNVDATPGDQGFMNIFVGEGPRL